MFRLCNLKRAIAELFLQHFVFQLLFALEKSDMETVAQVRHFNKSCGGNTAAVCDTRGNGVLETPSEKFCKCPEKKKACRLYNYFHNPPPVIDSNSIFKTDAVSHVIFVSVRKNCLDKKPLSVVILL